MARALLLLLLVGACGDDLEDPPVVIEAYGIRVTVTPVPARLEVVRLSDGEVIFDGRYGDPAGTADPPHGAIAFRAATPRIETQTGAFKIEDDRDAPWQGVATFQRIIAGDATISFKLGGPGGAPIGDGTVTIGGATVTDVQIVLTADPTLDHNRASIAYATPADEHLLGLGGQAFDVDHRGQTVPLWVEEDGIAKRDDDAYEGVWFLSGRRHSTHTPMPVFLSSRGYIAALDTDARAVFALASEPDPDGDVIRLEAWEDRLDLHLFVGQPAELANAALTDAIAGFTGWVGRPRPPPIAIFAPWLDALYGSANVRRVAQKLRDEDIPASAIWTEDWRGGNDEGTGYVLEEDWQVDRDLYPDFEAVADDLHAQGFLWLTYHNTFLDESADVFDEAIDAGYTTHEASGDPYLFTGVKFRDASLLDLSNPEAVTWAQGVYSAALDLGADGWMADFGEWLQHDAVLASGEDALLAHNRYPVEWAKLNRLIRDLHPGTVYFMRAAWLHAQPHMQVMWAGDQQTDWTVGDGMPSVIPIGIGLGLTGFPYYGHDLGGYMSQLTVPTTKELWFRWCTLSALSPVMRTHHGRSARDNWNWESDAETTAHLARWARLHISLFPYFDAMSEQAQQLGLPIMRPVALGYPDDGDWPWTTTDQYLLGDRILVAPVITEGATNRDVLLPQGDWVPLLGGEVIEGGGEIEVDAAITEIPAFVPAGTVLAMLPDGVDTLVGDGGIPSERVIVLYPGSPSLGGESSIEAPLPVTWSGRDPSAATPTTATVDGIVVPLTAVGGDLSVMVATNNVSVDFEGGGHVEIRDGGTGILYELRLRLGP